MEQTDDIRYRADSQTAMRSAGAEVYLLSLASGELFGLNPVAAQVWRWLAAPRSRLEIVQLLTAEFEVDEETANRDLSALLATLLAKELIVSVDAGSSRPV